MLRLTRNLVSKKPPRFKVQKIRNSGNVLQESADGIVVRIARRPERLETK